MLRERTPKKRAVNLFVDTDLLDDARRMQINLSDTLERRLRALVKAERERRWLEESKQAIESINAFIDRHGLAVEPPALSPRTRMTRQFDIVRNPDPDDVAHRPYLIVLQSDLVAGLRSAVVAPLVTKSDFSGAPRLNPLVTVEGQEYWLAAHELSRSIAARSASR